MIKMGIKLFSALILAVTLITQAYAASPERWKIGHLRQSGSAIDKDIHQLIDDISQDTENKIVFDVYSGSRLGDYSIVQERVSFGEVQLYVGPLATSIDKRLLVATTPYLVTNWSEAREVYHQQSRLLKKVGEYLAEQNIKLLGGWPVYFGGLGLREQPNTPGNPDIKKEMIIRVPPIRTFELTAKELGYTPYPITWSYATMGLKTGMVDGIIGGGAEGYSNFSDRITYYIPIRDHFEYWFIYMNNDSWMTLTSKEQKVFLEAVAQMEETRYHIAEEEEIKSIENLRKRGVNIIDLSEHELQTMQEKIRQNVWPVIRKEVGPEFDKLTGDIASE